MFLKIFRLLLVRKQSILPKETLDFWDTDQNFLSKDNTKLFRQHTTVHFYCRRNMSFFGTTPKCGDYKSMNKVNDSFDFYVRSQNVQNKYDIKATLMFLRNKTNELIRVHVTEENTVEYTQSFKRKLLNVKCANAFVWGTMFICMCILFINPY